MIVEVCVEGGGVYVEGLPLSGEDGEHCTNHQQTVPTEQWIRRGRLHLEDVLFVVCTVKHPGFYTRPFDTNSHVTGPTPRTSSWFGKVRQIHIYRKNCCVTIVRLFWI